MASVDDSPPHHRLRRHLREAWVSDPLPAECFLTVLALVDSFIGRPARKTNDAAEIRDELRRDIASLRVEVKDLRAREGEWRERHYAGLAEIAELKEGLRACEERSAEILVANAALQERVAALERRLGEDR